MANKVVVSVGADIKNRGEFYWDIKTAALEVIYVRQGFKSLDEAKANLEEFKRELANAVILVNA
jgi:phage terminase large subunit-like protein